MSETIAQDCLVQGGQLIVGGDLTPLREALEEKEIVVGQLKEQLSQAIEELSQKEAEAK